MKHLANNDVANDRKRIKGVPDTKLLAVTKPMRIAQYGSDSMHRNALSFINDKVHIGEDDQMDIQDADDGMQTPACRVIKEWLACVQGDFNQDQIGEFFVTHKVWLKNLLYSVAAQYTDGSFKKSDVDAACSKNDHEFGAWAKGKSKDISFMVKIAGWIHSHCADKHLSYMLKHKAGYAMNSACEGSQLDMFVNAYGRV